MMALTVGEPVMFVDFIGEGHRNKHWPVGFMITHGHRGEVVHVDHGWKETVFSTGGILPEVPTRYQVSWTANWFYEMMKGAYGYPIPPCVTEGCGPIEWAHRLHVAKIPNKKEAKELADVKKTTDAIMNTALWTHLLKHFKTESPVVEWMRKSHPENKDEESLPGDVAYVFRKACAYDWVVSHYQDIGEELLMQRYALLRDAALNEVVQKLTEEGVEITYHHVSNTTVGKEKHMATPKKAVATGEKAPTKKATKVVEKAKVSAAGGRRVAGSQVTEVLRETDPTPKAICKAMLEAFGVKIEAARIEDAPNSGIMKMRAGNLVRGALRREGRLA